MEAGPAFKQYEEATKRLKAHSTNGIMAEQAFYLMGRLTILLTFFGHCQQPAPSTRYWTTAAGGMSQKMHSHGKSFSPFYR
jgi:hypothetical protein